MLRKFGIIAVLSLIMAAVAAVPALAVAGTVTTERGGLHFVGTPQVTAQQDEDGNWFLLSTGEVSGAGTTATATLSADAELVTGCINRGSQDQQPSGLKRTTRQTSGQQTFETRSGRGTFAVETDPIIVSRRCPDQMTPVIVSLTFTNIKLTITSNPRKLAEATFPDIVAVP
jgi:hypothetical protein